MKNELEDLIPETIVLSKEDTEWFINQLLESESGSKIPNDKLQSLLKQDKGNNNVTILE